MDVRRFAIAQTNRYTAAVRKLLSIKGEEHDIGYGVHLEDERPEFSFIKGETLWAQFNEVTSAAGTLPRIGVYMPPGSGSGSSRGNTLGVITSIYAECDTVGTLIQLGFLPTGTVSAAPMWPRDLRNRGGAIQSTNLATIAGAVAASGFTGIWTQLTTLAAGAVMDFTAAGGRMGPVIVPPGFMVALAASAVGAVVLRATFVGYERTLESGELISG